MPQSSHRTFCRRRLAAGARTAGDPSSKVHPRSIAPVRGVSPPSIVLERAARTFRGPRLETCQAQKALRGIVWVMWSHCESAGSCREPRHDDRQAHKGCVSLEGWDRSRWATGSRLRKWRPDGNHRTVSTRTWKSRPAREIPTFPQPIPRGAEGRDEHERHFTGRPPVAQSSCRGGGRGGPPPAVVASLEGDGAHGGGVE